MVKAQLQVRKDVPLAMSKELLEAKEAALFYLFE